MRVDLSKLLLKEFMVFNMNYDVVCLRETGYDDADVNNEVVENFGFNIVYKSRSALSRYKKLF